MTSAEMLVFRPASLPPLSRVVLRAAVVVLAWETRSRTRKHLRNMPPHLLKDIGLNPISAQTEAELPFWRG